MQEKIILIQKKPWQMMFKKEMRKISSNQKFPWRSKMNIIAGNSKTGRRQWHLNTYAH